MTALVFMDTETTGLSLYDDVWEFAAIRREPDGTEHELHLFLDHDRDKCQRLPESFRQDHETRWPAFGGVGQEEAAQKIAEFTAKDRPHIVGAVPNFDTERLSLLLGRFGLTPGWHYHLIDVENLAVGYLHAMAREWPGSLAADFIAAPLPWDSDNLSRAVGVEPPTTERHTAMGDVRWCMKLYDAITGGAR